MMEKTRESRAHKHAEKKQKEIEGEYFSSGAPAEQEMKENELPVRTASNLTKSLAEKTKESRALKHAEKAKKKAEEEARANGQLYSAPSEDMVAQQSVEGRRV